MSLTEEDRFRSALVGATGRGIPTPAETRILLMFAHYAAVVEANRRFNLTRIIDPAEAAVKHFADSISLLGWMGSAGVRVASVLDVGTGAGFPAIPLAVMRPDWRVTAIDSTAKKVRFVTTVCARLELKNLCAEHRRAGQWKPAKRFDLVTLKAVGNLRKCVEQSRMLLKRNGYAVAYKTGAVSDQEREAGRDAARHHRFEALQPYAYRLRLGDEIIERTLWVFRKL